MLGFFSRGPYLPYLQNNNITTLRFTMHHIWYKKLHVVITNGYDKLGEYNY